MFSKIKKQKLFLLAFLLLVVNFFLFYLEFQSPRRELIFAALDVGQGDALYVESPTGTQILFDAGPPRKVLGQLSRVMPPFDRTIDAIVITNPDLDHIGGFADVLEAYKVEKVFEPGTAGDSKVYQNIKAEIKDRNIPDIVVRRGMRLHLGGGAVIDILFPDRDVSDWTTNDGSVVARLAYGNTSIMLTGDASVDTERIILEENTAARLRSTVLKAGHHGSRTSTSAAFLQAVAPDYAVISTGADNKYGHPHQETLKILNEFGVKILRTDILGAIILKSDGRNVRFSFLK